MSEKRKIFESFGVAESIGAGQIDRAAGVIRGVVILPGNKRTANGNIYTDAALRKAVPLYENAKMFIDHDRSKPVRSVRDLGGVYRNVRVEESKMKGDLHIRPSMKDQVIEIAEMNAPGVALSIVDKGSGEHKDGTFVVEDWVGTRRSADLVSEASSNENLFEENGGDADEEDNVEKKDISVAFLKKECADVAEALMNEGKAAVLKDLDEAKQQGKTLEDSLAAAHKDGLKAKKTLALHEAKFEAKVHEAVLKEIEPEAVSFETATAIIRTNKATVEAIGAKKKAGEPTVVGSGARQEHKEVSEDEAAMPSDKEIEEALSGR